MPEEKLTDERLARLYGVLAGLGIGRTDLHGLLQDVLGKATELGGQAYPAEAHGLPLWTVDPKASIEASRIRKYLGAPKVPIYAGPEYFARPPQLTSFVERHPIIKKLFGATKEDLFPLITARGGEYYGLAHEIGHTVPSRLLPISQVLTVPLLRLLGVGAGVGAALSDSETAQYAAPFIAAAPHVPEIAEEARASAHGLRGIYGVKGGKEAAKALSRLTPAFMTYLAGALPAIAAPFVAKAVKEHVKKKRREKTAQVHPRAIGRNILTAREQWTTPAPKPRQSKIGEPGMEPKAPPSKRKYFTDMQKVMQGLGARKLV